MISYWAVNNGRVAVGTPHLARRYVGATRHNWKRRLTDRPLAPAHPEAGVFAFGLGHWPSRPFDPPMDLRALPLGQWPREERERLVRRPAGGDSRLGGRAGSGKNVPSGNSRYLLNTWTCPSPPRLPSITNLVPTGNRLGKRLNLDAMTASCNTAPPCHCNV